MFYLYNISYKKNGKKMTKNFFRKYVLKPTAKKEQNNNLVYNNLCSEMISFCCR